MTEAWTEAIKEAMAIAPTGEVILHTLEIRQEGVQSVYLVQARHSITAYDENDDPHDFEPCGFRFSLPQSSEDGFQSINIAIDNIGRRVSDFITTALQYEVPITVIYRPYLSNDLTAPQMVPPLVLFLKDVEITTHQVTGRATFMDIVNRKFPSQLYNRERFPTLY